MFRRRRLLAAIPAVVVSLALLPASAHAGPPAPLPDPPFLPDTEGAEVHASLRTARGPVEVVVELSQPPLAAAVTENAVVDGTLPSTGVQQSITATVERQQDAVLGAAASLGATEQGRVSTALNAVVLSVDAAAIDALAAIEGVTAIRPRVRYHTMQEPGQPGDLSEADADLEISRQYTGFGVTVAVFDSGIDFTHQNLTAGPNGPSYASCYGPAPNPAPPAPNQPPVDPSTAPRNNAPTADCAKLFGPNAPKVVGGYDFVGELWPVVAEKPDPNPIDYEGHGTHVADIIGGYRLGGDDCGSTHCGIAPSVEIYGYKVCSSIATTCSDLALYQAIDAALDPDGDGNISDAPQLWNFSLGSDWGQPTDSLTNALNNVTRQGITVVASAGNGGDKPWIVGSPSTAPRVISVAQTAVPDAVGQLLRVDPPLPGVGADLVATFLSFSEPLTEVITAPLARPAVAGGLATGCTEAAFDNFPPTGAIALVDRGTCNISLKLFNAEQAGAVGMVLVNNQPGYPPDFSFGGPDGYDPEIPGFSIRQDPDGTALKAAVAAGAVTMTMDPGNNFPLDDTVVGNSSRGPSQTRNTIKPDLGAPGAWLSAEVGTGNGETTFGGTSGAAPTVTGAAAVVKEAKPRARPMELKQRLLSAAGPVYQPGDIDGDPEEAPISRVGAGEVRVDPAWSDDLETIMGDPKNGLGNLSFGVSNAWETTYVTRSVRVRNLTSEPQIYDFSVKFRDGGDEDLDAIDVIAPSVFVPPGVSLDVPIVLVVRPGRLPAWPFAEPDFALGGVLGNDGSVLDAPEIDGWLVAIDGDGDETQLGWHLLPRQSARVTSGATVRMRRDRTGPVTLRNASNVVDGAVEVFGLTGTSGQELPADFRHLDLAAVGVREDAGGPSSGDEVIQFAFSTYGRRPLPLYPAMEVQLDTDRDGNADWAVYNDNLGDGSAVSFVLELDDDGDPVGAPIPQAYVDGDFSSGNAVLTAFRGDLELRPGTPFDFVALAYVLLDEFDPPDEVDYFIGGDIIEDMTWTVGQQRYTLAEGATVTFGTRQARGTVVQRALPTVSSQTGLLLQYRVNGGKEFTAVTVEPFGL